MSERIEKLLSVKSIVTIVLTLVFAYLCVVERVSAEQFLTVFTVVIAFYFGTQHEKANREDAIYVEGINLGELKEEA